LRLPSLRRFQEGNRVAELVRRYDAGLRESGIDPVYPDTISLRAGAYAHSVAEELTDMAALIRIDPQIITDAAKTCAKAWTYLWEAMREIYSAGRYVFRNQARTKRLFYSRPFIDLPFKQLHLPPKNICPRCLKVL